MPQAKAATSLARVARTDQKRFQNRKARIASIWTAWLGFERPLREKEPSYLKLLYDLVREIAQERDIENHKGKEPVRKTPSTGNPYIIQWDEARDRVLPLERLETIARNHGRKHRDILVDVSRVASHNSWMARLNRMGEYWILSDIMNEVQVIEGTSSRPVFAEVTPLPMARTASEINRLLSEARESDRRVEEEFLGAAETKERTDAFPFLTDVDRQARFIDRTGKARKKARNWRREC